MTRIRYSFLAIATTVFLSAAAVGEESSRPEEPGKDGDAEPFQSLLAFPTNFNPRPLPSATPALRTSSAPKPPPLDDPRVQPAFALMRDGETEAAVRQFKEILVDAPANKQIRFGLGTALIKSGAYAEAIEVMSGLMADYPKDYFIKNNLAWLYATAKDPAFRDGAQCVALAQEALLDMPTDYHVWSTLAEGYYILGEYEKALRAAAQAYTLGEQQRASARNMLEYRNQVLKCRRAAEAMSLIE